MKRLSPQDFDALVRTTPNAKVEADDDFSLQYLMVGKRTIAVSALEPVEPTAGRS